MLPYLFNIFFTKFSIPTKDEGFHDVRYEWAPGPKCQQYLEEWIKDKKRTTRIENLQPGQWCHEQIIRMKKCLEEWQAKSNEARQVAAQKTYARRVKELEDAKRHAQAAVQEHERKLISEEGGAAGGEVGDQS